MQPMLNIALRAARSASELIFRSIERLDTIKVDEKDAKDYVSEVDRAAEQKIIDALRKAYPTHGILGEETGMHPAAAKAKNTCGSSIRWTAPPTSCAAFHTSLSASPANTAVAWNTLLFWTRFARKNSPPAVVAALN